MRQLRPPPSSKARRGERRTGDHCREASGGRAGAPTTRQAPRSQLLTWPAAACRPGFRRRAGPGGGSASARADSSTGARFLRRLRSGSLVALRSGGLPRAGYGRPVPDWHQLPAAANRRECPACCVRARCPAVVPPARTRARVEDQRDPERQRDRDDDRHHDKARMRSGHETVTPMSRSLPALAEGMTVCKQ